jgi:hypothetical protein
MGVVSRNFGVLDVLIREWFRLFLSKAKYTKGSRCPRFLLDRKP